MSTTKKKTWARPRKPKPQEPEVWKLRLYVAGNAPNSLRATGNARAICEALLAADRSDKIEKAILPSEVEVIDRLLARGLELNEAYEEIFNKLHEHPHALKVFFDLLQSTAAFWSPEANIEAREGRNRLVEVNLAIQEKASELASLLSERTTLKNHSGFSCDTAAPNSSAGPLAEEGWSQAVELSASLPDDLQGVFLVLARAALTGAVSFQDDAGAVDASSPGPALRPVGAQARRSSGANRRLARRAGRRPAPRPASRPQATASRPRGRSRCHSPRLARTVCLL